MEIDDDVLLAYADDLHDSSRSGYVLPDLTAFDATSSEVEMVAHFTRIRPVNDGDAGECSDGYTSWLLVGNQHFRVGGYWANAKRASWYCWQLAKALLQAQAICADTDTPKGAATADACGHCICKCGSCVYCG